MASTIFLDKPRTKRIRYVNVRRNRDNTGVTYGMPWSNRANAEAVARRNVIYRIVVKPRPAGAATS